MSDPFSSQLIPDGLREALRLSPDNVPLLIHAGESVLKVGGLAEAEALFKRALAIDGEHVAAKTGLATTFFQQGAYPTALVIAESLTKSPAAPVAVLVLHARLALKAGEPRLAAQLFGRIRETDPAFSEPALEQELGNYLPKRPTPTLPSIPTSSATHENRVTADSEESGFEGQRLPAGVLPDDAHLDIDHPDLTFADVGGMERVKEEIRLKIILPLQQPDLFKAYGKKAGGGILLYGPPGCGKTFLARATAGEVKAGFLAIGINDVLDMWIGQSEKNLHAIFEQARSHRPSVLFFDEVDALGANRTDMLKSGGRHLINQFLSELDGVASSNEGVLILAATNAPWHLDAAFRRPGRFDRIIFVPPPDGPARAAMLRLMLRGKPIDSLDCDVVAKKTEGFSGADMKAVVDLATEAKLQEAMKSGQIRPITGKDLLEAAKRHKPTVRDWFETARNYALYANQSGLYDDILAHLKLSK